VDWLPHLPPHLCHQRSSIDFFLWILSLSPLLKEGEGGHLRNIAITKWIYLYILTLYAFCLLLHFTVIWIRNGNATQDAAVLELTDGCSPKTAATSPAVRCSSLLWGWLVARSVTLCHYRLPRQGTHTHHGSSFIIDAIELESLRTAPPMYGQLYGILAGDWRVITSLYLPLWPVHNRRTNRPFQLVRVDKLCKLLLIESNLLYLSIWSIWLKVSSTAMKNDLSLAVAWSMSMCPLQCARDGVELVTAPVDVVAF